MPAATARMRFAVMIHNQSPVLPAMGKPPAAAFVECFNGQLSDELMNETLFSALDEARPLLAARRRDYNEVRPHSAIGNKPPVTLVERSAEHGHRRPQQAGKSSSG